MSFLFPHWKMLKLSFHTGRAVHKHHYVPLSKRVKGLRMEASWRLEKFLCPLRAAWKTARWKVWGRESLVSYAVFRIISLFLSLLNRLNYHNLPHGIIQGNPEQCLPYQHHANHLNSSKIPFLLVAAGTDFLPSNSLPISQTPIDSFLISDSSHCLLFPSIPLIPQTHILSP